MVGIAPCDTIYGIIGKYPETESKIRALKGREENKPFIVLIKESKDISIFSDTVIPESLAALWPGPLTLIVCTKEGKTLALRVPADPFIQELLVSGGAPLFSTSVNRSGQAPLNKIREIIAEFEKEADFIVDGGDLLTGVPSTILDISVKPYKILRQGACNIPPKLLEGQ